MRTAVRTGTAALLLALAAMIGGTPGAAQEAGDAGGDGADTGRLLAELNKLEGVEAGCRSFFLFRNDTDVTLAGFEMSLAVLDRDGVIDRLLTIDAAPLPSRRTTLKLFDIPDMPCADIGEVILHDIATCEAEGGGVADCFAILDLSSRADVPFVL
ncbi:Tat pathway signal protein [Roseospira goensis]|uniref:Tat pathway signal sequence domain protein n=1 Tax=Roseospira goensis TaxID=391922 RepID=A0A7W6WJB8_9PROT|nr:Tat pathway signal protein [Roseospira goensis]MBB4284850.1 hypothetical protein [Roseospira goensis]